MAITKIRVFLVDIMLEIYPDINEPDVIIDCKLVNQLNV